MLSLVLVLLYAGQKALAQQVPNAALSTSLCDKKLQGQRSSCWSCEQGIQDTPQAKKYAGGNVMQDGTVVPGHVDGSKIKNSMTGLWKKFGPTGAPLPLSKIQFDVPAKEQENYYYDAPPTTGDLPSDVEEYILFQKAAMELAAQMSDVDRVAPAAAAAQQSQATAAGNAAGEAARDQSASAIGFCAQYINNFTATPSVWTMVRDQIFVPMAILLLLPGAVLAQARAIVAAGSPVLGEVNPFEGILRSIVAIFLIPGTALVVNYGIDLSNSITFTINSEYMRLFGSDMYQDATAAEVRATPVRAPQSNVNNYDSPTAPMGTQNFTGANGPFSAFERRAVASSLQDPSRGINQAPANLTDEALPAGAVAERLMMNGSNAGLASAWNVLCAFQLAYLYYLWCVGPIMAALWVYPLRTLRNALPSWIEGVITLCFWSLFWNTVILLMAIFKGVDESGTVLMTALNFLATASVKYAFDFAGLVKAAGQEAAGMAMGAAQQAAQHGGGGGGGAAQRQSGAGHGRGASGTRSASTGAHVGGNGSGHGRGGSTGFMADHGHGVSTTMPHQEGTGGSSLSGGMPVSTFHPATGGLQAQFPTGTGSTGSSTHNVGALLHGVPTPPLVGSGATDDGHNAPFHFDQMGHMLDQHGHPVSAFALDQHGNIIGQDLTLGMDQDGNINLVDANGNSMPADATLAVVDDKGNIFTGDPGSLNDDGTGTISLAAAGDGTDGEDGLDAQTRADLLAAAAISNQFVDADAPPLADNPGGYEFTDEDGNIYTFNGNNELVAMNGQDFDPSVSMQGQMTAPPSERPLGPTPENMARLQEALQHHGIHGVHDPSSILAAIQQGGMAADHAARVLAAAGLNQSEAGQFFPRNATQLAAFGDQSTFNSNMQSYLNQYGDQGMNELLRNATSDQALSSMMAYQTDFSPITVNDASFPLTPMSAISNLNQNDFLSYTSPVNPLTLQPNDMVPGGLERLHPGAGIDNNGASTVNPLSVADTYSSITGTAINGDMARNATVDGSVGATGMTGPTTDRVNPDMPLVSNGAGGNNVPLFGPGGAILDVQAPFGVNPNVLNPGGGSNPDPVGTGTVLNNPTLTSNQPMGTDVVMSQPAPGVAPMQLPDNNVISSTFNSGPVNNGTVPIFNESTPSGIVSSPIVNPSVFGPSGGDNTTFSYPSSTVNNGSTFTDVATGSAPVPSSNPIPTGNPTVTDGGFSGSSVFTGSWGTQVASESGPVGTPTRAMEVISTDGVGAVNTPTFTFNNGNPGGFESAPGGMQTNQMPAMPSDVFSTFNNSTSNGAVTVDNSVTTGGSWVQSAVDNSVTTGGSWTQNAVDNSSSIFNGNPSSTPVAANSWANVSTGGNEFTQSYPTFVGASSVNNSGDTTFNASSSTVQGNSVLSSNNTVEGSQFVYSAPAVSSPVSNPVTNQGDYSQSYTQVATGVNNSSFSTQVNNDGAPVVGQAAEARLATFSTNGAITDAPWLQPPTTYTPASTNTVASGGYPVADNNSGGVYGGSPVVVPAVQPIQPAIPEVVYGSSAASAVVGGAGSILSSWSNSSTTQTTEVNTVPTVPTTPTTPIVSNEQREPRPGFIGQSDISIPVAGNRVVASNSSTPTTPTQVASNSGYSAPGSIGPVGTPARKSNGFMSMMNNRGRTSPPPTVVAVVSNTGSGTGTGDNVPGRTGSGGSQEYGRYQPQTPDGDGPPPIMGAMPGSSLDEQLRLANQRGGRIAKTDAEHEALMKARLDEMTGISGMPDTGGSTSLV